MMALDGVTRYGLSEAVKFILRGALGHAFLPSPPELRLQCEKSMEFHVRERNRIARREQIAAERIPDRQEPTPEQKARAAALTAAFHASHEKVKNSEIERERAEIRARYGMTPELLSHVPDAALASTWRKAS